MAQIVNKDYIDGQITRIKNMYDNEIMYSRTRTATIDVYESVVKTINRHGTAHDLQYLNAHIESVDIPKTTVFTGPPAGGKRKSKRKLRKRKTHRR